MDEIKELKQLQTALKNTQGVISARKAPKQIGLYVNFRGGDYRVDFVQGGWKVSGIAFPEDLDELQALVPMVLEVQQHKESEAIAEVEAKKAEEKKAIAEAEANEKARKAKLEELREACHRAYIPGFNSQDWAKEKFGRWNFNELALEELEILWAEMKQRAKAWEENPSGKYPPNLLRLSWEEVEEAIAPTHEEEFEKRAIAIDADQLAAFLSGYLNPLGGRVVVEASFIIQVWFQEYGDVYLIGADTDGAWSLDSEPINPFEVPSSRELVQKALSQAHELPYFRKQQHAEALRMAPEQAAELMRRSKAGDEEADQIILNAMNECLGARCDEAFKPETLTIKGKALTLKQPWAWAVFNCGKNIENRSWDTSYRGLLFIHAGQAYDHSGAAWIAEKFGVEVPGPGNLPEGAIVGWVELGSVSRESFKPNLFPWAMEGQYHWHLKRPYQFHEPVPCQGKLGLWSVQIPFPAPPQWILDNAEALWDYGSTVIPNGKPYRPSNGSEGGWFLGGWCEQCSKLNSCSIPVLSMAGDQPAEWVYWDRKPICLAWDEAIADKPLAYYPYQGNYKVGDAEGNLEEFESAEEAIEFINNWGSTPEAKSGKSLATYQIAEGVVNQ